MTDTKNPSPQTNLAGRTYSQAELDEAIRQEREGCAFAVECHSGFGDPSSIEACAALVRDRGDDPDDCIHVTKASYAKIMKIIGAAAVYVGSVNGDPEKDCWDTEDGKEAPGAERFASDWAWKAYDDAKQKAFDDLRAALATTEGSTDGKA